MNILVIGNGFDLAHGLPTQYGDFLEYVKAFYSFTTSGDCDNKYSEYFSNLKDNKKDLFLELDELTKDNRWMEYFIRIYEQRKIEGKDGWIDFESEISSIIQALDAARHTLNEQFKKGALRAHMEQWQLNILCPYFNKDGSIQHTKTIEFEQITIKLRKEHGLMNLNRLTRCLEIYLCDYLSYVDCKPLKDIAELDIQKLLSFNYTNTYKRIYDTNESSKIEYDFIHGKANLSNTLNNCNLVLGIDEYLSGDAKNKDNEFVQFKKFYQRIYKGTGCHYVDWIDAIEDINTKLAKANPPEHNIYFYGHSLDITDSDILKRLITTKRTKTTIFYHNQQSMGSQIANLVKVIGEEELIKRTDGRNRSISFKQSSTETV